MKKFLTYASGDTFWEVVIFSRRPLSTTPKKWKESIEFADAELYAESFEKKNH